MALRISADLRFEVDLGAEEPVRGWLRGAGSRLQLDVSDPGAFAGSRDAPAIRGLAEELARRDVVVKVVHDGRHLVSIGAVSAPWWQRRATGSRRIRIGSLRGAWTAARSRARSQVPVLPAASMAPPATLFPLAPTFARRARRRPSTTHDPARGGSPHLVLVRTEVWAGERQPIFWLGEQTTIGSHPTCDIVLDGLEPVHARVEHNEFDEYVLISPDAPSRVHGAPVEVALLRTGARIEMGPHQLVYTREEYADHGRPHGGRLGGEAGVQLPQTPRDQVGPPPE